MAQNVRNASLCHMTRVGTGGGGIGDRWVGQVGGGTRGTGPVSFRTA